MYTTLIHYSYQMPVIKVFTDKQEAIEHYKTILTNGIQEIIESGTKFTMKGNDNYCKIVSRYMDRLDTTEFYLLGISE